jgi:hypothetical protein
MRESAYHIELLREEGAAGAEPVERKKSVARVPVPGLPIAWVG